MEENQNTNEAAELLQEFPLLEELMSDAPPPPPPAAAPHREASPEVSAKIDDSEMQQLRAELENVRTQITQLEHERWLLSQGIPEEDLDYYAFKIGKLVTPEKDFASAAKDFLKSHRGPRGISTSAGLTGRVTKTPTPNDTMNRLIRGTP